VYIIIFYYFKKALGFTNHVINNKKIYPKKAIPRQVKLFVGGLTPDLTDDDIKDYFERYAPLMNIVMPYDKVRNQRKGFCFFTFDSMKAVTEILKTRKHVINGIQVINYYIKLLGLFYSL